MNTWPPPRMWLSYGSQWAATGTRLAPHRLGNLYSATLDALGRLARGAK